MEFPQELRYTKEHEWVKIEDNQVRIGITDFAQDELGDIVFVELPEVGQEIKANTSFGNVESVKTVSELYAPIDGKVVAVNEELDGSPENINDSPYEEGWMIIVEPNNVNDVEELLTAEQYKEVIEV
ncbi:glycine cleavage system H protein [Seinonella peptonophila]|uniref:Glycine cleavage system H protein n=1 Tax=Seinonella peptonophila TaxID=112248 RepID=A0A1M5AJ67_9BACL|nr:glycine cleavage system protein GcvH [Seinonella peptonophila]SHF30174.1 glycine cleavage system H protein [Seinonella peptonophila]